MKRCLMLLVLLLQQNAFAQSVLRLQHLSVEEGLSQSSVNYIFHLPIRSRNNMPWKLNYFLGRVW